MNDHFRQGDILLVAVQAIPPEAVRAARQGGRLVLASGENASHSHVVLDASADLLRVADGEQSYLLVDNEEGVTLSHEEHAALKIAPGRYRVVRQREYGRGLQDTNED